MGKKKEKSVSYILVTLLIAVVIAFCIAEVARRFSGTGSRPSSLLDWVYFYLRNHVWQFFGTLSLVLGIWFSLIRRRIYVSLFFMIICFLCAFVFPFLNLRIFLF